MSKIALDVRRIPKDRGSLTLRYAIGLGQLLAVNHELIVVYRQPYQLDLLGELGRRVPNLKCNTGIDLINNRRLNREGVEVLLAPDTGVRRFGAKFKVISTYLNDYELGRQNLSGGNLSWDRILTGSVAASKRLVEGKILGAQPTTIFSGPILSAPEMVDRNTFPEKTLIYGGQWIESNRLVFLKQVLEVLGDFRLIIYPKVSEQQKRKISELMGSVADRLTFADVTSTRELAHLINQSFGVVFTEPLDPNGLMPVDAMTLGAPCFLADLPLLQELGGPSAAYFDERDPLSLASRVREIQRLGAWARASEASIRRSQQLSWKNSEPKIERLIAQLID